MPEASSPSSSSIVSSPSTGSGFGTALAGAALGSALAGGYSGGVARSRMAGAMPIINAPDGKASFTYFDPMELKPRDPVAASLSGAFGGGVTGAIVGALPLVATHASKGKISGAAGLLGALCLLTTTAIGAVLGSYIAKRNTAVHNSWADRFTRVGFEQNQNDGPAR